MWRSRPTAERPSTWGSIRGDERTRTADPLLAKQVLYQLSYVPLFACGDSESHLAHGSGSGSLHST
jgi:hypothetical protein